MATRSGSFLLEQGYGCVAVFGAAPVETPSAPVGSIADWLEVDGDEPILTLRTGAQIAAAAVELRHTDQQPGAPADMWEDVGELSVRCVHGLSFGDLEDGPEQTAQMPPGTYRLRISASGRTESAAREEEGLDDFDEEPLDRFLLELWPAPPAPAEVLREKSTFARNLSDPPEPDWPVERAPGMDAARRIAADLTGAEGGRRLSGRTGRLTLRREVAVGRVKAFNRVMCARGWPCSNGALGVISEEVGSSYQVHGDPPDATTGGGIKDIVGVVHTVVLACDKPRAFVVSWNWQVATPDEYPRENDPWLLDEPATVRMDFENGSTEKGASTTFVTLRHEGLPVEWIADQELLWAWDIADFVTIIG